MNLIKNTISNNRLLIALTIAVVFVVLYLSRQVFYFKYDAEYYEDRYYHSQWNIPDSVRSISDGELYKFVGYKLVEGENPFNINFEVPPFAKYLYGASSYLFGNPYLLSIALYVGSIAAIFLLLKELFTKKKTILLGTLLFASTPFIATQVRETMLDLPLTFLVLIHTLFFVRYLKGLELKNLLLAGLFLGLASGAKLGVYTPLAILSAEAVLFYIKKYRELLLYPFIVIAGYLGSYFMYFIQHPNPIPWLRLHQKAIDFYMDGGISATALNQWKLIFLNQYEGWWNPGNVTSINDWSLLLPIGVVAAIIVFYKALKQRDGVWFYLAALAVSILIVNTIIPIYPRYLMPAIPLLVVLTIKLLRKFPVVIFILFLLNIPILFSSLYSYDATGDVTTTAHFVSIRAYKELYKMSLPESLEGMTMEEFIDVNESFYDSLGTRKIEMTLGDYEENNGVITADYTFQYHTDYGTATHDSKVTFQRYQNRWQLVWDWDYLWPGYEKDSEIIVEEGKVLKADDDVISRKTVHIIPRVMNPWNEFLDKLADVTFEDRSTINTRVRSVVPDHFPRFVGHLDPTLSEEAAAKVASEIPGVTLRDTYLYKDVSVYIERQDAETIPIEFTPSVEVY